jgi:hypothetical protein
MPKRSFDSIRRGRPLSLALVHVPAKGSHFWRSNA